MAQRQWHFTRLLALSAVLAVTLPTRSQADQLNDDSLQPSELFSAALKASDEGDSRRAIELLDRAIGLEEKRADLYRWRGREWFRLGEIKKSLADFDRVAKLAPNLEKTLWERGIAQYYARLFDAGAKQFELYQTYHDADVENATWRYLCVARSSNLDKARKTLLPIQNDPRVPMMQIYDLYRGKLTPDDVLKAAVAGEPAEIDLRTRLFYSHLYIGLYYEAAGDAAKAKEHITTAANQYRIGHYMGDVARIHAERLAKGK